MLRKQFWAAFVVVIAFLAVPTIAGAADLSAANDQCPFPQGCISTPAAAETVTTTSSSSSSETHVRIYEKVTEKIRHYERARGVIVAVYQGAPVSARGCVDPTTKGWIKPGGAFRNTRRNGGPFWTVWKAGWEVCGAREVKINGRRYIQGVKRNCGNRDILIPLGFVPKVKVYPVLEVRSFREFERVYDKFVKSTANKTSTTSTKTVYSCPDASWTLVGSTCFKPVVVTPPPVPQYQCVSMSLSTTSITVGQTVTASVTTSESGGATFRNVRFDWGDSTSTETTAKSASKTYNTAGSYTVVATPRFTLPNGSVVEASSAACRGVVNVAAVPAANQPPMVQIENPPAHVCPGGVFTFRGNFSDPETPRDNLFVSWTTNYGTISSGREQATYTAPGAAGTATVTLTVSDGIAGHERSSSATFPVPSPTDPRCRV